MLPTMQDGRPGWPVPTRIWQDADGEVIEPMLPETADEAPGPCAGNELRDLIASRPSRHRRETGPHAWGPAAAATGRAISASRAASRA